ncbi:MAG: site-2 protease family protein [Verrucomicrobiota bacterium]|nr:site-2 protease family protein [Verrucomicrobiota bacterium]
MQGLVSYLCFIPVLTFHEFAHAWMADKCGDDTARLQGRVSLNPAVHIDPIGTIALPLLAIFLSAGGSALSGFIIGWGKPVPVNLNNLSKPRLHDTLISMAGPAMNILIAIVLMPLFFAGLKLESEVMVESVQMLIFVSLFLCWFNMLPIPPLDGSHLMKHATNMSYETYFNLARYGFLILILVINFTPVREWIATVTVYSFQIIALPFALLFR